MENNSFKSSNLKDDMRVRVSHRPPIFLLFLLSFLPKVKPKTNPTPIRYGIIISMCVLIFGCSATFTPVCRHNAVLAALTVGEQYPVRMVWGNTPKPGIDKAGKLYNAHVQAQAFINGEWCWLQVTGGMVQVGSKDNYNAWNVMSVKEFIDFEWKAGVK